MLMTDEEFPNSTITSHSTNLFWKKKKKSKSNKNIHTVWIIKYLIQKANQKQIKRAKNQ